MVTQNLRPTMPELMSNGQVCADGDTIQLLYQLSYIPEGMTGLEPATFCSDGNPSTPARPTRIMVDPVGIEPTTYRLRVECSSLIELRIQEE